MPQSVMGRVAWLAWLLLVPSLSAHAQIGGPTDPSQSDQRTPLDELDRLAGELEARQREAEQPRFELFRSQVLPFDVLPFMKPNHWATMGFELRANREDYRGVFRTAAEAGGQPQARLVDTPRALVYERPALLPKRQTVRRELTVFLPGFNRNTNPLLVELAPEPGSRPEAAFQTFVQRLEPHQWIVPVLSRDPETFNTWAKSSATLPYSAEGSGPALDRQLYYRLVYPSNPEAPALPDHPLCWTTTSHLIWREFNPEGLSRGSFSQQQALIDWLHWGGQITILATGPSLAALEDSPLGPYLPARYRGQADPLTAEELQALSDAYRPPFWSADLYAYNIPESNQAATPPPREHPADPIEPSGERMPLLARLEPLDHPDVRLVPIAGPNSRPVAIERRIGRGRITLLALDPSDPALTRWKGLETLIRRVVFRKPVEAWFYANGLGAYRPLAPTETTWLRYVARDLGAEPAGNEIDPDDRLTRVDLPFSESPAAAWIDTTAALPTAARATLERSSGLVIPDNRFVLRVLLLYLLALVPLNWVVCRFLFRRQELAWAVAPLIAFGFALGVERMAAVDVGFNSSCDEIDLVEIQSEYPRAHLTRFGSLYTSGRVDFTIRTPGNPTSLILPMRSYRSLRNEQIQVSTYRSGGDPQLAGFQVQPRSLAMFRAESMVDLGGGITLEGDLTTGRVINRTTLELLDPMLVDVDRRIERALPSIAAWNPGQTDAAGSHIVDLGNLPDPPRSAARPDLDWAELDVYLQRLRDYVWNGPAERGAIRLVAWARDPQPGLELNPRVDRHRGVRLVVAHLRYGLPGPDDPAYTTGTSPPPGRPPDEDPTPP
ncbi:MAG: hypothetical protein KatS3mg108_1716 [Isosphaeraceae bacterium]|jgi:hypothetical protein|nr:MAG: hypothetical protein KatS3mg108_1716 [Isosphaeraceae bacterium]